MGVFVGDALNDGRGVDSTDDEPELARPERITDNLVVLYQFDEGAGDQVADTSGVDPPLPLTIRDPENTAWEGDWLTVEASTIVQSSEPADKVFDACQQNDSLTVEAWVRPAQAAASGPLRIMTLSANDRAINVLLGQGDVITGSGDFYVTRLTTSQTSPDGFPTLETGDGTAVTELTHVVMTRSPRGFRWLYLNGERSAGDRVEGSLGAWSTDYLLTVANATSGDRPFLGELHLVAIYCRNLTADEVLTNFAAGPS